MVHVLIFEKDEKGAIARRIEGEAENTPESLEKALDGLLDSWFNVEGKDS